VGATSCAVSAVPVCPAGQGIDQTNNGPPVCAPCPPRSYNPSADYICKECPTAVTSGSTTCVNPSPACGPGFMDYGYGCEPCPPYSYQPSYGGLCAPCLITGNEDMGIPGFTKVALTTCVSPLICPPGTEATMGGCLPCPPNMYNARAGGGGVGCLACPSGTTSSLGSTACSGCKWGSVMTGAGTCQPCPVGTYQVIGDSKCTACTTGTTTTMIGSFSVAADNSVCLSCPAGTYFSRGTCLSCPAGTYGGAGMDVSSCTTCPSGQTSVAGSQTSAGCYSTTCAAGQMNIGGTCVPCPVNTYQPSTTGAKCLPCPAGTTATLPGASACMASQIPIQCVPGTYKVGAGCMRCPRGSYSDVANAVACTPCASGTSTAYEGSSSVSACGTGESSGYCTQGTYFDKSYLICQPCPQGTYGITAGATSASEGCGICPTSAPISAKGTRDVTGCAALPVGTTTVICDAGYFATSGNTCAPCPVGTYSSAAGGTSIQSCWPCQAGYTTYVFGATACANSGGGVPALNCKPGFYVSTDGTTCVPCPINTYSATFNSLLCTACPAGTSSAAMSPSASWCKSTGSRCPPGTYTSGSACALCPPGTWSNVVGATALTQCTMCPRFTGSPAGAVSIDSCGTGGALDCPLGTYYSTDSFSPRCMPCNIGDYGVMGDKFPICLQCATGLTSSMGATACVPSGNTMSPTMAPVPSVGTFSLDMSLIVTGTSAAAFNNIPAYQTAFSSTLQAALYDPNNPTNVYTITNLKAADIAVPSMRRALQSANSASKVSWTVATSNANGATADTVNAQLYVTVNNGDFSSQLAQYSAVNGATGLQSSSVSSLSSATTSSGGGGGGGGATSSGGSSSKAGPGGAIGGAIGGIIVLGIIYYYYSNNQKDIARQAAEQAASATPSQNNPMQKTV